MVRLRHLDHAYSEQPTDSLLSAELRNFFTCIGLWLIGMVCQMWLTRTHYVQYWRYQREVIFTMELYSEEGEKVCVE